MKQSFFDTVINMLLLVASALLSIIVMPFVFVAVLLNFPKYEK